MPRAQSNIDEQAAEWLIRLQDDDLTDDEVQQFDAWRLQDPRHAAAVDGVRTFVDQLRGLSGYSQSVHRAVGVVAQRRPPRRRTVAGAALGLLALAIPLALIYHARPPLWWLADLSTAPAHWQTRQLADHSTITLAGNSAIGVHFDAHERRIDLLQGEILVEVAADPNRPFLVHTEHGTMQALGTRFLVRREEQVTVLTMLESKVAAQAATSGTPTTVVAGEQARISQGGVQLAGRIDPARVSDAWQQHQLVVQDQPLIDVLDEIALHRSGFTQFDRQALSGLRVSTVLPLDDPQRALQLITEALPVRVRYFTPWWVVVERR